MIAASCPSSEYEKFNFDVFISTISNDINFCFSLSSVQNPSTHDAVEHIKFRSTN